MKKNLLTLLSACFILIAPACAFDPDGNAPGGGDDDVTPDAGPGTPDADTTPDAAPVTPDATTTLDAGCDPDAAPPPPDTHEIYCTPTDIFSTIVEFRGDFKTGMVDNAPSWTPESLGYGADVGGFGWPPPGGVPNPASYVASVVTDVNGRWVVFPQTFEMYNNVANTYVQGLTPYISSGDQVKWVDMAKWTVAPDQWCVKSPSGTKLCDCWGLPCTLETTYGGCYN